MAHRIWSAIFQSLMGTVSKATRRKFGKPNLALERMEDRTTPTISVSLSGNDLQLTYGAANDAATISNDGTNITVSYTGDGGTPFAAAVANVSQITVTDPSSSAGQALIISGSAYTLNGNNGLSCSGVESYSVNSNISGSQVFLDVNSTINLGASQITTTFGQQYLGNVNLFTNAQLSAGTFINFGGTINRNQDLTLSATGNITFGGAVGGGVPLGAISIANASDVTATSITAASVSQTSGSGTTTLNGAVTTSAAVGVSLASAIIEVNGAISATASAGVTLTASNYINVAANITTGTGGVNLTANTGGTATGDTDGVSVSNNAVISTTSNGSITISGKGGSGNGNQNNGVNVFTGSSISANGSGTVNITGTGGSGTGNSNWGLRLDGQITSQSGTITLTGTYGDLGTSQTNSNGIVIFSTSGVSSTSGSVNITATGATTAASQALFLDASVGVGAGQSVTVTADSVWIFTSGSINATSTGTVAFATRSVGTQIDLGGSDVLSGTLVLGLEDAELDSVTAGTIIIGTATSGAATVSSAVSIGNNTNLQLIAAGISQSASLSVAGSTTLNAGTNTITLTQAGNDFTGAVTATGAATQITDANALTVSLTTTGSTILSAGGNLVASGTVTGAASGLTTTTTGTGTTSFGATTVGQNLSVTSVGAVSQTGALLVTGTTQISAAGQAISLTQAGNDFTGAVTATGAATQITDANALTVSLTTSGSSVLSAGGNLVASGTVTGAASDLTTTTTGTGTTSFGATTVGQNLSVTSVGAVSQTGALLVTGTTNISAAGQAISLTQAGNDFTGAVTATGAATQITDANALTVALTTTGSTVLSAGGNLVASGTVTGAASGLTTTTTGTGTTSFGATTVGQNLSVTSVGAVSQTGALLVTGTTNISAAGQAISLTQAGNDFTGAVTATGVATQITDANALTVSLATTGSTVLSAGGNLVASGTVTGAASGLTTTTTGTGTTTFGATTVGQNLSVTSVGAVSQTGALSVAGTATFAAGTSSITLNTATNAFSTVTVISGGNVSLAETGGFNIGGISGVGAGNISIQSSGTVAASGAITTTGIISLNGLATTSSIGIAGGAGDAQYASTVFTNLSDGASQIVVGSLTQTGMVTVGGTVSFSDPVVICAPGTGGSVTVNGAITGTGNASVTLSASPTTIFLNADITTAGQPIVLDNGNGGATSVVLGANVTLSSGAGNININATVNGAFSLILNSTGTTTLTGAVGGTTPLASITTNAGGNLAINGGSVKTTGNQSYNDAVTLGADTTLTGVAITLGSTVDGAQSLTINASGLTTLGGAVGSVATLSSITTDAPGSLALNGGSVKTSGNQLFNDGAVTVGTTLALITTSNGNITLAGVVNAGGNLVSFDANGASPGTGTVEARNAGNDFGTVEVINAYTAAIRDVNDLDIGQSNLVNDLNLTADGNLTDSGSLTVGNVLTITATGGDSVIDAVSSAASLNFFGTIGGNSTQYGRLYVANLQRTAPRTGLTRVGRSGTATAAQGILTTKSGLTPVGVRETSKTNNTITLFTNNAAKTTNAQFYFSTKNNMPVAGLTSKNPTISAGVTPITSQSFSIDKTITANNTYNSSSNAPLVYLQTSKASRTATNLKSRAPGDYVLPFAVEETNSGVFYGDARSPDLPLVSQTGTLVFSIDGATDFTSITAKGATLGSEFALISSTGFDPELTRTFTIINNTSASPVNGTFAGLSEGAIVNLGSQALQLTYKGGDGNDVVLSAVNDVPNARGAIVSRPFANALLPGNVISTVGNAVQFTNPAGASRQMLPFLNTGYRGNLSASGIDRTGDGVADAIVAGVASPNNPTTLRVIDAASGRIAYTLTPFGPNFRGGMRVSAGIADIDGEVRSVIVVGAGPGSTPRVKVYDSVNGELVKSFNAFGAGYRHGVTVSISTANVNDPATTGHLVVATLLNPVVKVFDLSTGGFGGARLVTTFNPFGTGAVSMVNPGIQIGNLDDDRTTLEIVIGAGYGSGSVQVFDAANGTRLGGINPFPPSFRGGVRIGLDDVDRDGVLDIVMASSYRPTQGVTGIASAVYMLQRNGNNDYLFSTIKGAGDNFFSLFTQGESTADFYLGINPAINRLPGATG